DAGAVARQYEQRELHPSPPMPCATAESRRSGNRCFFNHIPNRLPKQRFCVPIPARSAKLTAMPKQPTLDLDRYVTYSLSVIDNMLALGAYRIYRKRFGVNVT